MGESSIFEYDGKKFRITNQFRSIDEEALAIAVNAKISELLKINSKNSTVQMQS